MKYVWNYVSKYLIWKKTLHSQEADTDDDQGSLTFEEFCTFYKLISTRRDLYLLMITYSGNKEHMDVNDLHRFLENEQKAGVIHFAYRHVFVKYITLLMAMNCHICN